MKIVFFLFAAAMSFGNVDVSVVLRQIDDVNAPVGRVAPSGRVVVGDQVDKLGDNLMLVYRDSKGSLWFGTWGDGLYRYDGESLVHFTTKHGLCHDRIDEILEDAAGGLYFNTSDGVSKFDGKVFSTLPVSYRSEWQLSDGDLWFKKLSNVAGKVYRYDGAMLHELKLPKHELGERYVAEHPRTPTPYGVYTVYRDSRKNVWIGTAALGVCRYDGKSFHWIVSDDVNELHDGPSNGVRSIVEDHEGLFWFNTLFRYRVMENGATGEAKLDGRGIFSRVKGIGSLDGKPGGDPHKFLSIAKDDLGGLWIATYNAGVYHYYGGEIKHYPVSEESKPVTLFSIHIDNAGGIWLGTHKNGAYRFDGQAFVRYMPAKR